MVLGLHLEAMLTVSEGQWGGLPTWERGWGWTGLARPT